MTSSQALLSKAYLVIRCICPSQLLGNCIKCCISGAWLEVADGLQRAIWEDKYFVKEGCRIFCFPGGKSRGKLSPRDSGRLMCKLVPLPASSRKMTWCCPWCTLPTAASTPHLRQQPLHGPVVSLPWVTGYQWGKLFFVPQVLTI